MLAHVPPFGRNPRGSLNFLMYPVPKPCMHVLGTGVPRRLGVAHSASSPIAVQALGCSLTPGLRISFGRVTCMARAASVPGPWTLGFLLLCGFCDWVRVVLGCAFRYPASPGWGLGWVCLGTVCGATPLLPAGVCGVCGWAPVLDCTPPFLVRVVGRAWLCVRDPPAPRRSRFWCAVWACVLGSVSRLRRATPLGCVCACVPIPRGLLYLLVGGAVRRCVVGPGLVPRPATSGWGVGACMCLCARPACTPPFLSGVCCVGVRAGLGSRLCPAPLGWVVGVCVRSCVCPACLRPSWGAACGAEVCGCCCWSRLPPLSPLVLVSRFFWGGGVSILVLWCRSLAVLVLGLLVSVPPSRLLRAAFFFVPAWCVSACFGCPFFRWAAAAGLVLPVLAGRSPCAPLGGPVFGAVWPGGLADLAPPPPCFCLGVGGLPVPPSAFPGLAHALVGIQCGVPGCCWWLRFARPCQGPMRRVGYVHIGLGAPSCRVRFWLCRLGGCAGGFLCPSVRGGGVSRVLSPPLCRF